VLALGGVRPFQIETTSMHRIGRRIIRKMVIGASPLGAAWTGRTLDQKVLEEDNRSSWS
jgi:hypothetical protein